MKERQTRASNIELLRILSMIMIIISHYASHGGLVELPISVNHVLGLLFKVGGKLGVICFTLISTYFLSNQQFKTKSILKLILQTSFYAILLLVLAVVLKIPVTLREIIITSFPIVFSAYWFVTAYFGMYLAQPLLKKCVEILDQQQSRRVCLLMFVMLSIIPTIFGNINFIGNNFVYFVFLFFVGNHIRKYGIAMKKNQKVAMLIGSILGIVLLTLAIECIVKFVLHTDGYYDWEYLLYSLQSPLMLTGGGALFLLFLESPKFFNQVINKIATCTFAVYLLHDNFLFKKYLWHTVFKTTEFFDQNVFFILGHVLMCVIVLFAVTMLIETIRKKIEENIMKVKIVAKFCEWFDSWYAMI